MSGVGMKYKSMVKKSLCAVLIATIFIMNFAFLISAKDRNVRITSVRIKVEDYLRHSEYDTSSSGLPSISENDFTVPDNGEYDIDNVAWYGDSGYGVSMTPYVEIYLTANEKERNNDNYTYYYFSGTYDSSNVHITGGSFVSARLEGNYGLRVIISLNGIKGTYDAPTAPVWSSYVLGKATWTPPSISSGYYRVNVYRDSTKVTSIITDQTSINLYPYMTRVAAYYFEVATVPYTNAQLSSGKESEKIASEFLNISQEHVSDGTGQYPNSTYILNSNTGSNYVNATTGVAGYSTNIGNLSTSVQNGNYDYNNSGAVFTVYNSSTGQMTTLPGHSTEVVNNAVNTYNSSGSTYTTGSWYKQGNNWYFKTSQGTLVANDWLIWKNAYYRFDSEGRMVTGFYNKDDYRTYYLSPNGDMKTGWVKINNAWYYFNPQTGENYGLMYRNNLVTIGEKSYFFDAEGRMVTGWVMIKDGYENEQYYYFYPQKSASDNDYGQMARGTTVLGSYQLADDGHWIH